MPSKGKKQAEVSFEDAVEKLESIVEEMESDELPLDKLLVRYEEGTKLVKACEEQLQSAETRITQLEKTLEDELVARPVTLRNDED
ncbi:MAG: exodeoxyribonuclease VII small subunit [Verrucomicrobia subdivision 3 bacterium]|nr:exodeoxyribonuclease VII small subunit [Limisphaerales bacterium]